MKPMNDKHFAILRRHMIELIELHTELMSDELGREALTEQVLEAMRRVPRHLFVPNSLAPYAYQDTPLPIGFDKTISQPFIVALMTDLLAPRKHENILEIGTGLGYQTAILAELASWVWSVEIVEELSSYADIGLRRLGYTTVDLRIGDGSRGWAEHGPYDKILATAAAEQIPTAWIEQLKPGGRLVLPVGPDDDQHLTVVDKSAAGQTHSRELIPVRFSRLETII